MPPVTKAGGTAFRKDVAFRETKASDEYELEASGIVMVPDKADLQNDFAREDTIREFAEQFAAFEEAGQAGGGIMHAVWPDGWMSLERNEVLDEAEEIGGETVDAGAWVQRWGVDNAELADLIDDGILGGYSIGAIQVSWDGPFEPDEDAVDDVDTSELPDDEMVWELTDGIIREVSAVDIPAVPDAQILEAKDLDLGKQLAEHVGNQDAFVEEAMERGHSEEEAERLWDVLNEAVEADGSAEPGKQSVLQRAGKAFLSALTGSDDGDNGSATPPEDPDPATAKEGRTLNRQNEDDLKAVMDAAASVFRDAGRDPGFTRFTDREDDAFDLTEHTAREFDDPEDEEDEEEQANPFEVADAADEPDDKDATGGDTPDADMTDDPNDNNDGGEGDKSLAEQNAEQITELTQAVEDLADSLEPDEEKTVELEIGGEIVEVTESEAKAWFEDGEEPDADAGKDADDPVQQEIQRLNQRIDTIVEQSGASSDQLSGHAAAAGRGGAGEEKDALDALAEAVE